MKAFLGTWKLLPKRSTYESGSPPQQASYIIAPTGSENRFAVEINWIDYNGIKSQARYNLSPDGKVYISEHKEYADEVMSEFEGDHCLVTYAYKNGIQINKVARKIGADGKLEILQKISLNDGNTCQNVQYFKKVK